MLLDDYFKLAIKHKASDLYLIAGERPVLRITGKIEILNLPVLKHDVLLKMFFAKLSKVQISKYENNLELDFAYNFEGSRFRMNLHQQKGQIALSARVIPEKIPEGEDLGFTDVMYDLCDLNQGLVLVTGPSGVGKSTTLAAMIQIINKKYRKHVITMEDPIEFIYERENSVIEQREIGQDSFSFANALTHALRQDPDVLLVGEMRDLETISAALTAAETGHLVLSTLHTFSAAETVERIVGMFSPESQRIILTQLASILRGVISQQLLPKKGGGLVAAREIMINNPAISNLIRENKISQIPSVIQTSFSTGMFTMDAAIKELYNKDLIDKEEVLLRLGKF